MTAGASCRYQKRKAIDWGIDGLPSFQSLSAGEGCMGSKSGGASELLQHRVQGEFLQLMQQLF